MVKSLLQKIGYAFIVLLLVQVVAFAQSGGDKTPPPSGAGAGASSGTAASSAGAGGVVEGGSGPGGTEPSGVNEASFQSRCENVPDNFPACADTPSECKSEIHDKTAGNSSIKVHRTPFNCLFLEEPIGGRPGHDLFMVTATNTTTPGNDVDQEPVSTTGNNYELWHGQAIVGDAYGPVQAVLVFEVGKESQGPFGLLYNYLALVYNFVSGIIVGFAVLVIIVGGIMISTAGGEPDKLTKGKDMIKKALIGMVLWFTASVILYTINPTFFSF